MRFSFPKCCFAYFTAPSMLIQACWCVLDFSLLTTNHRNIFFFDFCFLTTFFVFGLISSSSLANFTRISSTTFFVQHNYYKYVYWVIRQLINQSIEVFTITFSIRFNSFSFSTLIILKTHIKLENNFLKATDLLGSQCK